MKIRIATKNVQHTPESVDKPFFYSRKYRKANKLSIADTTIQLWTKYINYHFAKAVTVEGSLLRTTDFMKRDIIINLNNNLDNLDVNYIEITDLNGEVTYWHIDEIQWVTTESVRLALVMDAWVSYFLKLSFKGNLVTPKRLTGKRFKLDTATPVNLLPSVTDINSQLWIGEQHDRNDKIVYDTVYPNRDNTTGVYPFKRNADSVGYTAHVLGSQNLYMYAFFTYKDEATSSLQTNYDTYDVGKNVLPEPLFVVPVLSDADNAILNPDSTTKTSNAYKDIIKFGGTYLQTIIISPFNLMNATKPVDKIGIAADKQPEPLGWDWNTIVTSNEYNNLRKEIFSRTSAPLEKFWTYDKWYIENFTETDKWDMYKEPKMLMSDYCEFVLRVNGEAKLKFGAQHLDDSGKLTFSYCVIPSFKGVNMVMRLASTNPNLNLENISDFQTTVQADYEVGSTTNSYTQFLTNHKSVYNNSIAQGRFNLGMSIATAGAGVLNFKNWLHPIQSGENAANSIGNATYALKGIEAQTDDLKRQAQTLNSGTIIDDAQIFSNNFLNGDFFTLSKEFLPKAQMEAYAWYYHKFGYKNNRPMVLSTWDDLAIRSIFNYIEIDNLEEEGMNLEGFGLPEVTEEIDRLFAKGLRLFTVDENGQVDIGNYTNANYDNEVLNYNV